MLLVASGAAPRARLRPCCFALLALALGSLLALLVLELGLRVTGYDGARERDQRVFDPKYGTVNADSWIFSFRDRSRSATARSICAASSSRCRSRQASSACCSSATRRPRARSSTLAQSYPLRFQPAARCARRRRAAARARDQRRRVGHDHDRRVPPAARQAAAAAAGRGRDRAVHGQRHQLEPRPCAEARALRDAGVGSTSRASTRRSRTSCSCARSRSTSATAS